MSIPGLVRRRELLLGGAALGAWALTGCGSPALAWNGALNLPAPKRFPLGAASGDATADRAVLWTRYLGSSALWLTVVRLARNPDTGEEVELAHSVREVTPEDGGFVHALVEDLVPGERYRYMFSEALAGADSETAGGTFRAAISPTSREPLVFTASSCSRLGYSFAPLGRAAEVPADLHVLLGDTVYADGATTLEEYRGKWAATLGSAEYRALRRTRSVIATWDDHEVKNNWSGENAGAALREHGEATFFEHTPMLRDVDHPGRVWRRVRWGLTAEFFVLDGRSERRPETRGKPDGQYLSRAQLDWFKAALRDSPARFKVVVNSVPIGQFPGPFDLWQDDRWEGYPAQREELLSFIEDQRIEGVFFLSGDFHMACHNLVSTRGPGKSLHEVLVGAAATSFRNPVWNYCRSPQFSFASVIENTAVLELEPQAGTVRIRWLDGEGQPLAERVFQP